MDRHSGGQRLGGGRETTAARRTGTGQGCEKRTCAGSAHPGLRSGRSERKAANLRVVAGTEGSGAAVRSLRRLVTILQKPARRAGPAAGGVPQERLGCGGS